MSWKKQFKNNFKSKFTAQAKALLSAFAVILNGYGAIAGQAAVKEPLCHFSSQACPVGYYANRILPTLVSTKSCTPKTSATTSCNLDFSKGCGSICPTGSTIILDNSSLICSESKSASSKTNNILGNLSELGLSLSGSTISFQGTAMHTVYSCLKCDATTISGECKRNASSATAIKKTPDKEKLTLGPTLESVKELIGALKELEKKKADLIKATPADSVKIKEIDVQIKEDNALLAKLGYTDSATAPDLLALPNANLGSEPYYADKNTGTIYYGNGCKDSSSGGNCNVAGKNQTNFEAYNYGSFNSAKTGFVIDFQKIYNGNELKAEKNQVRENHYSIVAPVSGGGSNLLGDAISETKKLGTDSTSTTTTTPVSNPNPQSNVNSPSNSVNNVELTKALLYDAGKTGKAAARSVEADGDCKNSDKLSSGAWNYNCTAGRVLNTGVKLVGVAGDALGSMQVQQQGNEVLKDLSNKQPTGPSDELKAAAKLQKKAAETQDLYGNVNLAAGALSLLASANYHKNAADIKTNVSGNNLEHVEVKSANIDSSTEVKSDSTVHSSGFNLKASSAALKDDFSKSMAEQAVQMSKDEYGSHYADLEGSGKLSVTTIRGLQESFNNSCNPVKNTVDAATCLVLEKNLNEAKQNRDIQLQNKKEQYLADSNRLATVGAKEQSDLGNESLAQGFDSFIKGAQMKLEAEAKKNIADANLAAADKLKATPNVMGIAPSAANLPVVPLQPGLPTAPLLPGMPTIGRVGSPVTPFTGPGFAPGTQNSLASTEDAGAPLNLGEAQPEDTGDGGSGGGITSNTPTPDPLANMKPSGKYDQMLPGPAPGKRSDRAPAGGGGGGAGGGGTGGGAGTGPDKGGDEGASAPQGPTTIGNKAPKEGYGEINASAGMGGIANRPGGGINTGPDLSGLMDKFLPKKEDPALKDGILEFGKKGASAGEGPLPDSLLGKDADIFKRIHDRYQLRQRGRTVGN